MASVARINELHPASPERPSLRLALRPDGPHEFEDGVLYELSPAGERTPLVVVDVTTVETLLDSVRKIQAALDD